MTNQPKNIYHFSSGAEIGACGQRIAARDWWTPQWEKVTCGDCLTALEKDSKISKNDRIKIEGMLEELKELISSMKTQEVELDADEILLLEWNPTIIEAELLIRFMESALSKIKKV